MSLTNPLGTIITSFPSTWDEHEEFNLSNILDKEIRENGHRRMIKSAEDLLHLIVKTSVDFIKRKGPAGFSLQESFRDSVTKLSEKQIKFFEDFRTTTWKLQNDKFGKEEKNKQRDLLLSVHREVGLLAEAMDIQDELSIVNTVLLQQMHVLRNLLDLCFTEDEPSEGQQKKGLKEGDRLYSDPQTLRELLQLVAETAVSNRGGSPPGKVRTECRSRFGSRTLCKAKVSPAYTRMVGSGEGGVIQISTWSSTRGGFEIGREGREQRGLFSGTTTSYASRSRLSTAIYELLGSSWPLPKRQSLW